ncbi:hypothetical protein DPMN_127868 [Dreissena polymorpha]|uniref:Uncharacterized protein n=1 Tax=Dreissena polymorpha TaxID=45954 RepID=A0A9D4JWW3_DREPO|nr:hypothetical protein DPMN_127868 [Dreissena polymorpha]
MHVWKCRPAGRHACMEVSPSRASCMCGSVTQVDRASCMCGSVAQVDRASCMCGSVAQQDVMHVWKCRPAGRHACVEVSPSRASCMCGSVTQVDTFGLN